MAKNPKWWKDSDSPSEVKETPKKVQPPRVSEDMTHEQLDQFALDHGIDLPEGLNKVMKVDAINNALDEEQVL